MREVNHIVRPLIDEAFVQRSHYKLSTVFIDQFVDSLPQHMSTLRLAMTTGDRDGALTAVAKLQASSHLVHAEQLAVQLADLEHELRKTTSVADPSLALSKLAAACLPQLHHTCEKTVQKLTTLPNH
jgi:HPt (histidine-containing phosphotransfer) domain-containing protein